MSTGGQDLFVICKNCRSEVSPYITECPYCGSRLRKRAPKLDREGRPTERRAPCARAHAAASAPGRDPGDPRRIASVRDDRAGPGGIAGTLLWRAALVGSTLAIALVGAVGTHLWWRLLVAPFTYANTGYAIVALGTIALFGWLLERRHGPALVLILFAVGAVGGAAVAAADSTLPFALGANGGALALLFAWAIPDLLSLRAGEDIDGDLLGTSVIGVVVLLMPLAAPGASWISAGVGVLAGILVGLPLALTGER